MSQTRPLIGVIACHVRAGAEGSQAVIDRYVQAAMRHADALAVIVPADPDHAPPREIAARLDGVMLTGSPSNVDPRRYGEAFDPDHGPYDPDRDAMALGLIDAAIALGRPVLGVCRGFQEINVAFGGTLDRRISSHPGRLKHHAPPGADLTAQFTHGHDVALTPGGVLASAYGRQSLAVNSVHFQGVDKLGPGLEIEARAPDGVIEAVFAAPNGAQILAVQWHPEWRPDLHPDSRRLFELFGQALRGERLAGAPRSGG
ncbi:MAG: gamma-glutamyl-gamma-aminobutyrate hydrolase family protein [Alphaproteobacteria bacterium]|jgi:putative glutamine amidotransferase|nr:gamma-glutamyl-gamma-aminobutyrate hydrolase family protein [Alphaproteobacteria bacterium]